MANAALNITNLTTTNYSLDVEIAPKRNIRALLRPAGQTGSSFDAGDVASPSELNTNPQIQAAIAAGKIAVSITAGTTDIPGSDVTCVVDSKGLDSAQPHLTVLVAAGSAGARDVSIYTSNFPFATYLADAQIMVKTAGTGGSTATVRDATAGGGNALTQAMSTAAVGRVRDAGTGQTAGSGVLPTLAKNSSLVLRMSDGTAALTLLLTFARIS